MAVFKICRLICNNDRTEDQSGLSKFSQMIKNVEIESFQEELTGNTACIFSWKLEIEVKTKLITIKQSVGLSKGFKLGLVGLK